MKTYLGVVTSEANVCMFYHNFYIYKKINTLAVTEGNELKSQVTDP